MQESYKRLRLDDIHIGVLCYGELTPQSPVLILIHGFTGCAENWRSIIIGLSRLQPDACFIAPDMLGHGLSDAPADLQRYQIEYTQQDLLRLLQLLDIEQGRATLLGYSMGGRIALYNALSGYFKALILESSSPGLATLEERTQRTQSDNTLAERIEHDGIIEFVRYWENIPLFQSQRKLPLLQQQQLHAQRLNNRPLGLANSLRGIGTGRQPSLHHRLMDLTLPTLLIRGALDQKFCTINQTMVQQIPYARHEIIHDAGHTVHLEQPEIFIQQVYDFWKAVG